MFLHPNHYFTKFWLLVRAYIYATIVAIFILWLLRYIVWSIFNIDLREEIWLYVFPIIITAILWYKIVYSKSKMILDYEMGRVFSCFKYPLPFLMIAIIFCSQEYFSETFFGHHNISNVQEIDINDKKIRYYTIEKLHSNTTKIGESINTRILRRSFAFEFYFVTSINTKNYNGITFWNTYTNKTGYKYGSNDLKSDLKYELQDKYRAIFLKEKQYSNTTFKRIFSSREFDRYQKMLRIDFPTMNTSKIVLLQAISNDKINYTMWGLIAFGVSILFIAIVALLSPLDRWAYDISGGQSSKRRPRTEFLRIAIQFIHKYNFLSLVVSYVLGVNIAMILSNSSYIYSFPSHQEMLHWGAMTSNLVLQGEYWRLITSLFTSNFPLFALFQLAYFVSIYVYLQKNMGEMKTFFMFILSVIIVYTMWIFTANPNLVFNGFYALTLALSGGALCTLLRDGTKGGIDFMPILSILLVLVCTIFDIVKGFEFVYYIVTYIAMIICGALFIKKI